MDVTYEEFYHWIFNLFTDALAQISRRNYGDAEILLKEAKKRANMQLIYEADECCSETERSYFKPLRILHLNLLIALEDLEQDNFGDVRDRLLYAQKASADCGEIRMHSGSL